MRGRLRHRGTGRGSAAGREASTGQARALRKASIKLQPLRPPRTRTQKMLPAQGSGEGSEATLPWARLGPASWRRRTKKQSCAGAAPTSSKIAERL